MKRGGVKKSSWVFRTAELSRKVSQLAFLSVFFFLFLKTDYTGSDQLEYAVNILFRIDPFLAAVTMLAAKSVIALMLPSLFIVFLSLLFGRSFCGWVCPMGTGLDGSRYIVPTDRLGKTTLYPRLGLWLCVCTLLLAFFGFHVAGYLDPFSLLVRGMVQALYPAFNWFSDSFFTFTYSSAPSWVNSVTEPIYGWMKGFVLPSEQKYFDLGFISLSMLLALFFLEMAQKRFFCRNLCPLGAMLGYLARLGFFTGRGGNSKCGKCRLCSSICRMGAIDETRVIDMSACNLCMECSVKCPRQIINFGFSVSRQRADSGIQHGTLTRRQFMGIFATGILLPSVKQVQGAQSRPDPLLIRPPGALPEKEFLGRCIRCGECLQVCIGNGLQPSLLEGGLDGLFSPKLLARIGYCEFNCTLCGQVCPTDALRTLSLPEKHQFKIGHAWFDKNLCLPYAKSIPCMVCEEHCPTPQKAIRFNHTEVRLPSGELRKIKQPYVVDELCIGCGICETRCPLPGKPGIFVTSDGEHRHPEKRLPLSQGTHATIYGG